MAQAELAIRTRGLSKHYGRVTALADLDLDLAPGEVMGYLGPNGAGKTTTIRLLLGFIRPTAGRAEIFGTDCQRNPDITHRRVAFVPAEASLWPSLTGAETLHLLGRVQGRGTPSPEHNAMSFPDEAAVRAEAWADLCGRFLSGAEEAAAIADGDAEKLESVVLCPSPSNPTRSMTVREQLESFAAHNAYHLGRVVLLRQLLGSWPPPSGGLTW